MYEIAEKPIDEVERLATLRAYDILDSPSEHSFDRITQLAAELCDAPVALITLVDQNRQWFKSRIGLDVAETAREVAFCAHAILDNGPLVIPETKRDARFQDNPLVVGPPHIRSYAGAPLIASNGVRLGTLCVIHTEQETYLSERQISQLEKLAAITVREMDLRRTLRIVDEAKQDAQLANEAKSRFLASVSHEIRTPLNGVLGMTNVLAATDLTREQQDIVRTIRDAGNVLLTLLNDVLDLSKIEAGQVKLDYQNFSISGLLKSAEDLWAPLAAEKGIQFFTRNYIEPDVYFRTDRNRLQQVIYNLLANALKFTTEGYIEIQVDEVHRQDHKRKLRIEVRDTGIGLSESQIKNIFEPFAQADSSTTREFGGTGLGLSISQDLTHLLGGEIGVESKPGRGSTFWFTVDVERGHQPGSVQGKTDDPTTFAPTNQDPDRQLRILVAEDNRINQKVVRWMLEPLQCHVDIVANGHEAVSAVNQSQYDLILMDMQMPEMDGIAATKKIRSLEEPMRSLPIIALTANAMQGDRETYLAQGMSDYIPKPIEEHQLLQAIARITGVVIPNDDISGKSGRSISSPRDQHDKTIN